MAQIEELLALASKAGGTVVRSPLAVVIVLPLDLSTNDPDEHLSLEQARTLGKFRTTRQIREAGRAGALALYGTERTRTVLRGEFVAWLASRRAPPVAGPADVDIERRVRGLARRKPGARRSK
jgi:hypothetical protein